MRHGIRKASGILLLFTIIALGASSAIAEGPCAVYDSDGGTIHIPSVRIGYSYRYVWIDLRFSAGGFRLTDAGDSEERKVNATYDADSMAISIPCIDLGNQGIYEAKLLLEQGGNIDFSVLSFQKKSRALVINEIVAKAPEGGDDWIELRAGGDMPVNLGDYAITDSGWGHDPTTLPEVTLNPGEYFVIPATYNAPGDGSFYLPFKLGEEDTVFLYRGDTVADLLHWEAGDAPRWNSYGRLPDGTGVPMTLKPTPERSNKADEDLVTRPVGWEEWSHGDWYDPDYGEVFPQDAVRRIDLTVDPGNWQAMLDDMTALYGAFGSGNALSDEPDMKGDTGEGGVSESPEAIQGAAAGRNPVWKPCTFAVDGKKWHHVGVRFKGEASLRSTWQNGIMKLPLRFDFDQFEDLYPAVVDQRFYGFKKLSLSSNYSDDSLIREKIVADIFRSAGVPAPMTAFCRLYIDYGEGPVYFGLYTMVEVPLDPMLVREFGNISGNLYKPEGAGASFASYDEAGFDKENNAGEADYSDVRALYDALHADRAEGELWRAGLGATFDVDGFLRWLAVNTVLQNRDTYGQAAGNYYLYNDPGRDREDPGDDRIHWIPWDNNMAMMPKEGILSLSLDEVGEEWPLIRYLMDDPVYRAKYLGYLEDTVKESFNPSTIKPLFAAVHGLIRPYVTGDQGEMEGYTLLDSPYAFESELEFLRDHVDRRYNDVLAFLAAP